MKTYVFVRNWVDDCLAGPRAMLLASVAVVLPILLSGLMISAVSRSAFALTLFGAISVVWLAFVFWRGWRLGKADAFKRDRSHETSNRRGLNG